MNLIKFGNLIKYLFSVNWILTLKVNNRILGSCKWKIPILIYRHSKVNIYRNSSILIDTQTINFGMIKLGINHEFVINNGKGFYLENKGNLVFRGSCILGNDTRIRISEQANLIFGKNCGITGNIKIICDNNIEIGDCFSCSWGTIIMDTDLHQTYNPDDSTTNAITKPIKIGNFVWLCQNSTIAKGSIIPDYVTIASNSLCNKEYTSQPFSILAGIPAKEIGKRLQRLDIDKTLKDQGMITKDIRLFNKQYFKL